MLEVLNAYQSGSIPKFVSGYYWVYPMVALHLGPIYQSTNFSWVYVLESIQFGLEYQGHEEEHRITGSRNSLHSQFSF